LNKKEGVYIKNLSKSYGKGCSLTEVIKNLNIYIPWGKFVAIFGPNGCGKTTLFNIIAGLIPPEKGEVLINDFPPGRERIGYVSQNYQEFLLPWRTASGNLALPLESKLKEPKKIKEIIMGFFKKHKINFPLDRYPYQLSGGQQQLLSIFQALISSSPLVLLDEPFSNLDYKIAQEIKNKIIKIWKENKSLFILVTHDLTDAILLANFLIVFKQRPLSSYLFFDIDFPYPRDGKKIVKSKTFLNIYKEVLAFIS